MTTSFVGEPLASSEVSRETPRHESQSDARWSSATRFAFRFSVIFFGVIGAGELLQYLPGGGTPWMAWSKAQTAIANWIIVAPLGLPQHSSRLGIEPLPPFVFECALALVALIAAVGWSVVDRRERAYDRMYAWLYALVRFALAGAMFGYAWSKVFPGQFGWGVSVNEITQTVGELTPQRLLWVFMGASRPYAFFGGLLEMLGALLLCSRATATAGALVLVATLANVVMLNFAYDVNVRVYSSTLLLMAVFVAARDLPRLTRVILGLATPVRSALAPLFTTSRWNRVVQIGAATMTVWLLYRTGSPFLRAYQRYAPAHYRIPRPVLDGIFVVENYSRSSVADSLRWTRVAFMPEGVAAWVRFASNFDAPYLVQVNEGNSTVVLTSVFPYYARYGVLAPQDSLTLTYARTDSSIVLVRGRAGPDSVSMRLRHVELSSFRLLQPAAFWSW